MLFRLKMSVEDAITAYTSVAKTVFTEKKLPHQEGTFKATLLESAIVKIIGKSQTKHVDEKEARAMQMLNKEGPKWYPQNVFYLQSDSDCCVSFVCAMSAHNMAFPTRFRSWIPLKNASYNCTIVEAARATSAAPTFFKGIAIGDENLKEIYVDGGLRLNNPVKYVISEAESAFPNREISCLLSLGTGVPEVIGLEKPDSFQKMVPSKLINVLKGIATDCEAASEDVARDFQDKGTYFRLNVDAGLENITLAEWTSLPAVSAHTIAYLHKEEVDSKVDRLLAILDERLAELWVPYSLPTTLFMLWNPRPSPDFFFGVQLAHFVRSYRVVSLSEPTMSPP